MGLVPKKKQTNTPPSIAQTVRTMDARKRNAELRMLAKKALQDDGTRFRLKEMRVERFLCHQKHISCFVF